MSELAARKVGLIGALSAFPRRLAAGEVKRQGGHLRRGVSGRTELVVFGRLLLHRHDETDLDKLIDDTRATGHRLLSENGFLRILGSLAEAEAGTLSARSLSDRSGLRLGDIEKLALFDAFICDAEPFAFRDLILARKYAELRSDGVGWSTIARAVHRATDPQSLTAVDLRADGIDAVRAHIGDSIAELSGQFVIPVGQPDKQDMEVHFQAAEELEAQERYEAAARAYERHLSLDPGDTVAAFNRANCLRAMGKTREAGHAYLETLKLDPEFVEAWFNYAGLKKEVGNVDAARRSLQQALEIDAAYPDAIYNLAALEFDTGNLIEAKHLWSRYLELDTASEWAARARRGIQFIDLQSASQRAG